MIRNRQCLRDRTRSMQAMSVAIGMSSHHQRNNQSPPSFSNTADDPSSIWPPLNLGGGGSQFSNGGGGGDYGIYQGHDLGDLQDFSGGYDDSRIGGGSAFAHTPTGSGPQLGLQRQSSTSAVRSNNVTESVTVPTSEHVAEIVGRQGKHWVCVLCDLHSPHDLFPCCSPSASVAPNILSSKVQLWRLVVSFSLIHFLYVYCSLSCCCCCDVVCSASAPATSKWRIVLRRAQMSACGFSSHAFLIAWGCRTKQSHPVCCLVLRTVWEK